MSNSHEPSYYEIALTNRQVVVAFVVLLACLLTAFFSGVWVGRGSAEREAPAVVRQAPPEPTEGADLQELDFFEQEGQEPEPGGATAQMAQKPPSPETTLQEDLAGRTRAEPAQPAAPAPPAPDAPEPAPEESVFVLGGAPRAATSVAGKPPPPPNPLLGASREEFVNSYGEAVRALSSGQDDRARSKPACASSFRPSNFSRYAP